MYILDKKKDYYDFLGSQYGIDKTITFDRRGSISLTYLDFLASVLPIYASKEHIRNDEGFSYFYFFMLEIGTTHYLFRMTSIQYKKTQVGYYPVKADISLLTTTKNNKHISEKEIGLIPCDRYYHWFFDKKGDPSYIPPSSELRLKKDNIVLNPILKDTPIPSLIPASDVWKDLSNYISSQYNDKTITIVNSDVEKAVNHGFDKVSSFRHPIKL